MKTPSIQKTSIKCCMALAALLLCGLAMTAAGNTAGKSAEGLMSIYLAELAGVATIGAFFTALWMAFIRPRQKKKDEQRERAEKARDEAHEKELNALREHFQLDATIKSMTETQKQQGEELKSVSNKISGLRKEVLEQNGEMAEMHTTLTTVDLRMNDHLKQTASTDKNNESRLSRLEAKMDGLDTKVCRMEDKVDKLTKI